MKEKIILLILNTIAFLIKTFPSLAYWIIYYSTKHPYKPIPTRKKDGFYMLRWWTMNPYGHTEEEKEQKRKYPYIPFSSRVHNIMKSDMDRHMHNHPFNAYSIILIGGYTEVRREYLHKGIDGRKWGAISVWHTRKVGDVCKIAHEDFHRITEVIPGTYTLFFTGTYLHDWGFLVPTDDGLAEEVIPHEDYEEWCLKHNSII